MKLPTFVGARTFSDGAGRDYWLIQVRETRFITWTDGEVRWPTVPRPGR